MRPTSRGRGGSYALLAAGWLAACGDPRPPVACDSIPQQTVYVGETAVVTPCFEDPEMEAVRLSAESSSYDVARGLISGEHVWLRAVSPGNATITVTAVDPDNMAARISFDVVVPNRPPELRLPMPDTRLLPGGSRKIDLSDFFVDPDGEQLAYRVEFSDPGVATDSVAGDTLIAIAAGVGTTTGTATATDPGGLSVSHSFTVVVLEPQRLLQDDFESEESLSSWTLNTNSAALVEDGMFWLENTAATFLGIASTTLFVTGWEVTAAMGNATSLAWVGLKVGADHERFSEYLIQIGADGGRFGLGDTDYRFFVWDEAGPYWTYYDGWYGQSDAIADVGDLTEITMTIEDGHLTATAGSTELVRVDLAAMGLSVDATFLALVTWPAGETTGRRGFFDWVELTGLEVGAAGADMRPVARADGVATPVSRPTLWRDQSRIMPPSVMAPNRSGIRPRSSN
ncbi:MAG: hypothetical protein OXL34_18580 [Gemmatimonadota bacterium]|nr:hypothetical protein [Gemmatimonadota bacterium]